MQVPNSTVNENLNYIESFYYIESYKTDVADDTEQLLSFRRIKASRSLYAYYRDYKGSKFNVLVEW
jgi:hypothetical protein